MYKWLNTVLCIFAVTPYAGVRIEIGLAGLSRLEGQVTPYAGVRIEIASACRMFPSFASPPTRGCELKWKKRRQRENA